MGGGDGLPCCTGFDLHCQLERQRESPVLQMRNGALEALTARPRAAGRAVAEQATEPGLMTEARPGRLHHAETTLLSPALSVLGSASSPGSPRALQTSGRQSRLSSPPRPSSLPGEGPLLPPRWGALTWGPPAGLRGKRWGMLCTHTCVLCVQTDAVTRTKTPTGVRTPRLPGEACVCKLPGHHVHTRGARICAGPRHHAGPGGGGQPDASHGCPGLCNACVYFTAFSAARGFQNTSGLFTELRKNISSPLQLSLPEGPGTCPSPRRAHSSPGFLKGPLGSHREQDSAGSDRGQPASPLPAPRAAGPQHGVPSDMKCYQVGDWEPAQGALDRPPSSLLPEWPQTREGPAVGTVHSAAPRGRAAVTGSARLPFLFPFF